MFCCGGGCPCKRPRHFPCIFASTERFGGHSGQVANARRVTPKNAASLPGPLQQSREPCPADRSLLANMHANPPTQQQSHAPQPYLPAPSHARRTRPAVKSYPAAVPTSLARAASACKTCIITSSEWVGSRYSQHVRKGPGRQAAFSSPLRQPLTTRSLSPPTRASLTNMHAIPGSVLHEHTTSPAFCS